jgi:hypothetical protein
MTIGVTEMTGMIGITSTCLHRRRH